MASLRSIEPDKLLATVAKELAKTEEIKPPVWAKFAKTGVSRERPPEQQDWWFTRAASMLRKAYIKGPMGVSKYRKLYGGRKNRGHKPEHTYPASGAVTRKLLQQLEKAGLLAGEKGKGRKLTAKGKAFMDAAAKNM